MSEWRAYPRMMRKMSRHKLANAWRIYRSYHRSKSLGRPMMKGMPIGVSVEPTTACNLRCPECPSGLRSFSRPTGNLNQDFFESFIEENAQYLMNLTFYFQGEPFIHKGFLDMVRMASEKRVFTSTSTNAHFLDRDTCEAVVNSGLDRMLISIDGTDQAVYEQYRKGGKLEKVINGSKEMVAARTRLGKGPELVFQFLVVKPNEHQIADVQRLADEIGIDRVAYKTAQIYDFEDGNPLIPSIDKYSRYRKDEDGKFKIKNPLDDQCWKMWHSCVITWDGKVVPCCFDKDAKHALGDLKEQSLESIWNGEAYNAFRQGVLKSRSSIDICRNCSEGTRVWA